MLGGTAQLRADKSCEADSGDALRAIITAGHTCFRPSNNFKCGDVCTIACSALGTSADGSLIMAEAMTTVSSNCLSLWA